VRKVQTHKYVMLVRMDHEVGSMPCKLLIDRSLRREQYSRAVRMRERWHDLGGGILNSPSRSAGTMIRFTAAQACTSAQLVRKVQTHK